MKYTFVSDWFHRTKLLTSRLPYMWRMINRMRVVLEGERAVHPDEASVQRVICAARGNGVRPHIEGARLHECKTGVHRNLSPVRAVIVRVRGSHACCRVTMHARREVLHGCT